MRVHHKVGQAVIERDGEMCRNCGADLLANFSSYWAATVDHVHAAAGGGAHDAANLVASCSACNTMLGRSGHLRSVDERKAFVMQRRESERAGYEKWVGALRADKVAAHPS